MTEANIRQATANDALHIVRLVLASADEFLTAVFGPRIARALEHLASGRGTLFSHEHAWIAETEDVVAGMLLGYTGREKAAQDPRTGAALLISLGPGILARLGRLMAARSAVSFVSPREFYLSNVGVYPEFQGRGIGSLLIGHAERQAAREGAQAIVLDVETDNEGAVSLYERLGFRSDGRRRGIELGGGSSRRFSFFRMIHALEAPTSI
jgi:ribosomal protein S18 acetylase RimI-like enzyme